MAGLRCACSPDFTRNQDLKLIYTCITLSRMEIRKTLMFSSVLNSLLHAAASAAAATAASCHKVLDVVQHLGLHVGIRHSEHGRGDALGCSIPTSVKSLGLKDKSCY